MSDTQLRAKLNQLEILKLIETQRRLGRMNLPADFVEHWRAQYRVAQGILDDERRGLAARKLARLLREVTFSVATAVKGERPNYYQYTDVHVLDWYLSPELATLTELKARTIVGTYYLLKDLLVFEAESLGDVQAFQQERFDREVVHTRVDVIREAIEQCQRLKEVVIGPDVSWNYDLVHYSNLEGYAAEPSRLSALIHFSCFPLTQLHDETVFIRVLHGSEFCFFGIRLCLTAAIEYIKRGNAGGAEEELGQAVMFATMLHRLLKILKTMPPEHFADFRDYTGKASALQSKSYHELDIYLRGVNTAKAEHFKGVPHLKILLRYADPRFVSLKSALAMRQDSGAGWAGVFESAQSLDRQLLTWRGLHLSFAKIYIPSAAPGTGGTSGAAYLKQHLGAGLFDDTVPDWDIVREIFPEDNELPGMLRAKSRLSISPDGELLAGADGVNPAGGQGS